MATKTKTKPPASSSRRGVKSAAVRLSDVTARLEGARAAVAELEEMQGELLELRMEEGASLRALGEELGVSHQTVANIVERWRAGRA